MKEKRRRIRSVGKSQLLSDSVFHTSSDHLETECQRCSFVTEPCWVSHCCYTYLQAFCCSLTHNKDNSDTRVAPTSSQIRRAEIQTAAGKFISHHVGSVVFG